MYSNIININVFILIIGVALGHIALIRLHNHSSQQVGLLLYGLSCVVVFLYSTMFNYDYIMVTLTYIMFSSLVMVLLSASEIVYPYLFFVSTYMIARPKDYLADAVGFACVATTALLHYRMARQSQASLVIFSLFPQSVASRRGFFMILALLICGVLAVAIESLSLLRVEWRTPRF